MTRPRRVFRALLIGFTAVLLTVAAVVGGALWWSLPPAHQVVGIPGLSAPVQIGIDADGIPRIEAATALDGAAALGFMHARDRMFQMELTRRVASGRLSEIVGPATLRLDRFNRMLGLRRRAEAELPRLDAATRAMLDAYSAGVNAWIDVRGRFAAPEFIVLGTPEPWTPVDSLLWGKTMALYLSGNWRQEMARAALRGTVPPERLRQLWPQQQVTPAPSAALTGTLTRLAGLVPAFPAPFTLPDTASNEWAVDGAHSLTGAPLLAGDPHLAFSMPGIWYLARIATPGGVLAGATAPGVPFLVMGHNGHIAWTFTTAEADTQDVFVETPEGAGYATPDGPRPFEQHEERIHVRGADDDVFIVRQTRHGPVLSDLDDPAGPVLAVAMASLSPGDTAASGLLALNRAATLAEGHAAAAAITAPVQNLLIADKDGIGQFTTGRVPVRRSGDGTMPVPGAAGAFDWTGFASGDALPHQVNPASGHLLNANERTAPPDFPVFMGQDWYGDWRGRRIRALLDERTSYSVASFAQMQVDSVSTFAQAVLPRLLRTVPRDAASRSALAMLQHWDGSMRGTVEQPLLFNAWMRLVHEALLARDQLPPGALGAQPDAIARALQGDDEATWCGTACDAMLSATLATAAASTARGAEWGEAHEAVFAHPILGRIPILGRLATWRIPQPGDDTTLFRGSPAADWTSVHGPSYRGVYDLADLDRSVFALAPGQSGHPLRHTAGNMLDRWRSGTSIRLGPKAEAVESVALQPR